MKSQTSTVGMVRVTHSMMESILKEQTPRHKSADKISTCAREGYLKKVGIFLSAPHFLIHKKLRRRHHHVKISKRVGMHILSALLCHGVYSFKIDSIMECHAPPFDRKQLAPPKHTLVANSQLQPNTYVYIPRPYSCSIFLLFKGGPLGGV